MCGRFALRLAHDEIRRVPGYDIDIDDWVDEEAFVPRYNIAPRSQAPVLRRGMASHLDQHAAHVSLSTQPNPTTSNDTNEDTPHYILQTMKWGLVPHWSKFEDKTLSTTNARSESLIEGGGMWASIKGKRRCAVMCQGYYEWLTKGKDKLPHFTKHRDGQVMLMAGLYDCAFIEGQQSPLWSFTIVTTEANRDFSWLHDRQPVILSSRAALDAWLDTSGQTWTAETSKLVRPYCATENPLECYQVPKEVGKVGTESSTFIEPIAKRRDGIQAMFAKQAAKGDTKNTSDKAPTGTKHLLSPARDDPGFSLLPHKRQKKSEVDVSPKKKAQVASSTSPLKSPRTRRQISPRKSKEGLTSDSSKTKLTAFFPKDLS